MCNYGQFTFTWCPFGRIDGIFFDNGTGTVLAGVIGAGFTRNRFGTRQCFNANSCER